MKMSLIVFVSIDNQIEKHSHGIIDEFNVKKIIEN